MYRCSILPLLLAKQQRKQCGHSCLQTHVPMLPEMELLSVRSYLSFFVFKMAAIEEEEIVDDQQFEALLTFTPEVQEAIEQVYSKLLNICIIKLSKHSFEPPFKPRILFQPKGF